MCLMWWFIKKIAETDTEVTYAYGYESKELTGSFSNAKNLTFLNIFEYYRKLKNSEKLTDRNKANVELFQIYIASDNSEYSREFEAQKEFLASNNIKDIFNQALKTNKELFTQNLILSDDNTYTLKIINYTLNMDTAINNIVEAKKSLDVSKVELYSSFKKEIAKHRADAYIELAEKEEKGATNKNLRSAQRFYYKANEIYSKYQSNYRNSYSKYEVVKNKADLNDAEDNYTKGMLEYRNAGSSKAKYRAANYYFKETQKYVANYKDTNKLLNETKEKGYFKYSLNSNNGDVKNKISNDLNPIAYPVTSGVELFIDYRRGEYSYNLFSYTNTEQIRKEIQTGIDSNGKAIIKTYNFTKTTTTVEELGTIPYTFSIRGAYYNNNISNEVTVKNTVNNVKYSGEVPPGSEYRNSDNKLLGSNELKKKVEEKLKKEGKSESEIMFILNNERLAYLDYKPINRCPHCKTGLANEDLDDGKCERCGSEVEQKPMRQWVLRITKYAQRLLDGLDTLDWDESMKELERNWIGKSEGTQFQMRLQNSDDVFEIYTTRIDTVFGMSFVVMAPEHPLVEKIMTPEQLETVKAYQEQAKHKTQLERTELQKEKT